MVSDLYEMNFNPVVSFEDSMHLDEITESFTYVPEILSELEKLEKSDTLIFIAPMYWGSVPAILKGWFDRIFVKGKVWDSDKCWKSGLLKGKKALLVMTVGSQKEDYIVGGLQNNSLENMVHHITWNTFAFCGLETLKPYCFYGVGVNPKEDLVKQLKDYEEFIEKLCNSL